MAHETQLIQSLARRYFNVETLQIRNNDQLDYHSVHVSDMVLALLSAYNAGKQASNSNAK